MSKRYLLITPCRNEADYVEATIACVAAQTLPPTLWVIVDDGSTDDTPRILMEAAHRYSFIRVVTRPDRGSRAVGPGVIDAFYAGLESADLDEFDYLAKLDADLEISPFYFERVVERFEDDPYLGTFSGKLYVRRGTEVAYQRTGDENSVGAAKFYRASCFRDIGGFERQVCWDGIDGHTCRMQGWVARSEDHPDLRLVQLRPMGASEGNIWAGRKRWGRGKYYMGSSPYYVVAVSLYRMFERPAVVGGIGILVGYLGALARREPRIGDREYRRFLRRYEGRSLLFGKTRTANEHHDRIRASQLPPGQRPRVSRATTRAGLTT
jgi:biofilm PGA synthesis N-glycosyltransferase PgaC